MMTRSWRKSRHSNPNGACLEARWQKSRFSFSNGNCLEARQDGAVQVRDSQDRDGPVLAFGPAAWQDFTARIRTAAP